MLGNCVKSVPGNWLSEVSMRGITLTRVRILALNEIPGTLAIKVMMALGKMIANHRILQKPLFGVIKIHGRSGESKSSL